MVVQMCEMLIVGDIGQWITALLGQLLRDDQLKPVSMSVRMYIHQMFFQFKRNLV